MLMLGSVSGEQLPPEEKVPRTSDLEVGGFPKARQATGDKPCAPAQRGRGQAGRDAG